MVAIFTGLGSGLARGSGNVIGSGGVMGSGATGRAGEGLSVNAATGNLVINRQDEFLTGPGLDVGLSRTYNSLAEASDGDNNDKWQLSSARRVVGLQGSVNTAGSTIRRLAADGSVSTYLYETRGGVAAYWSTDGAGAHDKLVVSGSQAVWTDGDTQVTETYDADPYASGQWRLVAQTDTSGQALSISYSGNRLYRVTTNSGEYMEYGWSGEQLAHVSLYTASPVTGGLVQSIRTRYGYDGAGRLNAVLTDLSPEDSSIGDYRYYAVYYSYDANGRLGTLSQSDGSRTDIAYDAAGRVVSLSETVGDGTSRVTSLAYGQDYTNVTAPDGQLTRLESNAASKLLTKIVAPPAHAGAAQQVQEFVYDGDGNLIRTVAPNGAATNFSYDGMGNVTLIDRPLGTDVRRWYDGKNRLVLEESYGSNENYDHVSHYNAYAYDGTGRLRYKVTPDGQVTEYRYDGYGRVLEEVAYRGQAFPYATVWIDEGMMNSWRDGLGDKTLRNITSHRYDNRGNLAYSYDWSTTDSAGNYSSSHGYTLTFYSYDANGRLLSKYRHGEVGESFIYDGLDRVVGSSSGASGVTTIFFDDANSRTMMHLSTGLTKTLTYNKAGDLVSEVSSATGANHTTATDLNASWGYGGVVRDNATSTTGAAAYRYHSPGGDPWRGVSTGFNVAAGETVRVRMSVRSDGTSSTHSFGLYSGQDHWGSTGDGQSQAVIVSGPGVLRQAVGGLYWIDGLSTTVETTIEIVRKYSQAASAGAYFYVGGHGSAPAGTGVILSSPSITIARADGVAAISTETLNSYDKLGRLRISLDNFDNGNRSYFVYDKAGRLTGQLDDYGALTEYKYDANNRLVQTSRYFNAVDAGSFAQLTNPDNAVTIDQLRPVAESRDVHVWTIYDANDRVVQTIDGTGAVTAFEYDGMGRAIRTTVHANRVSVAGWTSSPPLSPVGVSANASIDAVTRTFYNRQGQVRGVLDGEGYLTENVYDQAGRLIESIGYAQQVPAVYRTSYSFGDIRANAAPSSGDNRRTRYIYDGADQLRFTVDTQNRVTQYDYDVAGHNYRVVERALPISVGNWDFLTVYNAVAGHGDDRFSYKYTDHTGRTVRTTDGVGLNTYFWYDQAGNIVQTQVGDGAAARTTRSWYDARGALRYTIDAENYLTRYSYSTGGRLIQTTRFDNQASVGSSAGIQDVNAQTAGGATYTSFQYDNVGRVVREYNGNQEYTQYAYTRLGQVEQIHTGRTDATWVDQSYTHQFYDAAGRNYATYAALGEAERADSWRYYDARGNVTRSDDARGRISYAEYDRRGMLVAATDANGGVVRYAYNAFGEVTSVTDARGYTTTSQYNNLGQLSRTIDAAGTHTVYGYTRFGELLTVTKAGATTTFAYDLMGRVVSSTDALGGVERYSYDAFGDWTQTVNKLGGVTQYTYDKLGRLRYEWVDTVAYNDGGGVTANGFYKTILEYDSRGNVIRKLEGYPLPEQKITHYAYDRAGRLTQEIGQGPHGQSPTTQYRYDARGNLTSKVAPDGGRTVYYYDDLDRVTVEISPVGTFTSYGYDQNGNVTRIRVFEAAAGVPGDGGAEEEQPAAPGSNYRETVFEYDNLNRMTSSTVTGVTGRVFDGANYVSQGAGLQTRYQYDASGNVTLTIDPNGFGTYAYYDALGRKYSQVDSAGYRTDWTYDANGNVTREWRYSNPISGGGVPPSVSSNVYIDRITDYQYDTLGRRTVEQRLYVLMHDGNGNQYYGHPHVSYQYNALGQVVRKTEATGDWVNYEYDTSGRLMREIKSGYTDFGGAAVSPRVEYRYDSVGNLTRTTLAGNGNVADRVTTYGYDGGMLRWVADAEANDGDGRDGKITYYWYDIAGNVNFEYYTRYNSAGGYADGSIYDATRRSYDALGRVTQEWASRHLSDGWNDIGPVTSTTYNTFGEVASVSTGGGATRYNQYDAAGRLVGTNGDGNWKFFSYDKNGNQTANVESAGGDIAWQGFDWSLGQAYRADINASYTTYDARNMAVAIYEEGRDLSEGVSGQMLVTSRLYNAFGEVAREVSAAGAQIDYTYNTMGKVVMIENPTVSVQYENGSTANVRPTEHFYYDQSGRLVGQRDANGNLTRMHLLAGTGYNGGKAQVTHEIHADGGIIYNYYDAQGDARVTMNEVGRTFAMAYDQMGRLVQKTDNGSGLSDYFTYDGLGHQLTHWNTHYGSGNMEVTEYDYAGRVTSQRAFGGDTTTSVYEWYGHFGSFGGWREINYFANGRNQITDTDIFGKTRWRRDQGYHAYTSHYDNAGRLYAMTQDGTSARQDYAYYNTGKLKMITVLAYESGTDYNSQTTLYGYDRVGNVVLQRTTEQGQETYYYGYYDYYEPEYYTNNWSRQTQNITAGYDALGRMVSWAEHGSTGAPAASATYSYDAAGNIRRVSANYRPIDQQGNDAGYAASQEDWYRYDSMNRVVISHGQMSGGVISRGWRGKEIYYNAAGQRTQVWTTTSGSYSYWVPGGGEYPYIQEQQYYGEPNYGYNQGYQNTVYYTADVREDYQYDGAGRVSQVLRAESEFDGYSYEMDAQWNGYADPQSYVYAPGAGQTRGVFSYDTMGRLVGQTDYSGGAMVYSRAVTFDAAGRIYVDDSTTRRGSDLLRSYSVNYYAGGETAAYAVVTTNWKNGSTSGTPGTRLDNTYTYFDGAMQSQVRYDSNTGSGSNAIFTSNYRYDAFGRLTSASVNDGRPRTVTYTNDVNGQVIRRDEADNKYSNGDPHEIYYRLAGKQLGAVGNNGTDNVDYKASNDQRSQTPGTGAFRGGQTYGYGFAEFGNDYDAINSYSQGSSGGLYTVRSGDTLQGIAMQLWGDAGLWYKLAEANGLGAGSALAEGRTLAIPTGVQRVHNNANTMKPYDPAEALGDTSPTTPEPAKPKKNKCGVFGQILLAVVSIAVTVVLTPVIGPVGAAVVGNIASQTVGIATGIQEKFSFKSLAMTALTAGLAQGLDKVGAFTSLGISGGTGLTGAFNAAARGALTSAVSQGIATATGLQSKFSWAGVAAAGVSAGVGSLASSAFGVSNGNFAKTATGYLQGAITRSASALASAATKSAIDGSSFGENLLDSLPGVIAGSIVQVVSSELQVAKMMRAFEATMGRDPVQSRQDRELLAAFEGVVRNNETAMLNMGLDGDGNYVPASEAQRAAFDAAESQKPGWGSRAAYMVAMKEVIEGKASQFTDAYGAIDPAYTEMRQYMYDALLSFDVYFDRSVAQLLPAGYSRFDDQRLTDLGLDPAKMQGANGSGYFAALYDTGRGTYVFANRGTDFDQMNDWEANLSQGLGQGSRQYSTAMELARTLDLNLKSMEFGGPRLYFVGHSLGGGLATAQALVTGRSAVVFNPAGVHAKTVRDNGVDLSRARSLVTGLITNGEVLNSISDNRGLIAGGMSVASSFFGPVGKAAGMLGSRAMRDMPRFEGTRIALEAIQRPTGFTSADYSGGPIPLAGMRWHEVPLETVALHGLDHTLLGLMVRFDRRHPGF